MKRRATSALFLLLAAVATAAVAADGLPPPLSLDDAIAAALANSRLLTAAEADLRAAGAGVGEARAARLPAVALSEEVQRTDNPTLVFSNKLGQERFTAADFALDELNQPAPLTNFRSRMTVTIPLWLGGSVGHSTRAAELEQEAARGDLEWTRQQVIHQVADAYLRAMVAQRSLDVAREVRETVAAHLELVRDLFEAGLVVESDLLQVRVRESEVEEMVVRAESAVEVSRAALNLTMGVDQASSFRLDTEIAPRDAGEESLEELLAAARGRPDLDAAAARVDAAGEQRGAARAGSRPNLVAGGFLEANGEDLTAFDGQNWGAQMGFRWKLFDGLATSARVRKAEEALLAAEHRTALHAERIALEVRQGYHEVRAAGGRLEQARRAVEWAERSLTIVRDRYREGLATLVELLEAESGLSGAKSRRLEAGGDLLRARFALDLAVGRL